MRDRMTRAAAGGLIAGACALLLATSQAQENSRGPGNPGSGGLPGVTGTAGDVEPARGPDKNVPSPGDVYGDTTQRDPSASTGTSSGSSRPGSDRGRDERRGESRGVSQRDITRVRDAVTAGAPTAGTRDLRVFNRDGKAYVTGTVDSEAERDELMRRVHEIVGEENAVIELEIRSEGAGTDAEFR